MLDMKYSSPKYDHKPPEKYATLPEFVWAGIMSKLNELARIESAIKSQKDEECNYLHKGKYR
jgi:hypothetical protein